MQLCTTKYMHTCSGERERHSELGFGQYYNSRTETCLCCYTLGMLFFSTIWYIYQSQLTKVCFDLPLQIPAGTVREMGEGDRQSYRQ